MRDCAVSNETLTLSSRDIQRLEPLLARHQNSTAPAHLRVLTDKLALCAEAAPSGVPNDVVTMNSRVQLQDLESKAEIEYELVFPNEADSAAGRISVLAPLGASLIGARVGKVVEVPTPRGTRRLLVRALLFQPEAAGRYDL